MTKTAEDVRKDLEKRRKKSKKGGKGDWVKILEGDTYIRIGPPWKHHGEVWKDALFHGKYPNELGCAENEKDKHGKTRRCPVESAKEELKGERSGSSKKLWGILFQRSKGLWNVLEAKTKRSSSGSIKVRGYEDSKFKILRLSSKWHQALLEIFADEDYRKKDILGVAHPKYGRLIRVRRTGTDMDTNYSFKAMEKEEPIAESSKEREKLLGTLVNLDKFAQAASDEELETFLRRSKRESKKSGSSSSSESYSGSGSTSESDSGSSSSSASSSNSSSSASASNSNSSGSNSNSSSDSGSGSVSSSASASSSDSGDDLEAQYKQLKKKMKANKKH